MSENARFELLEKIKKTQIGSVFRMGKICAKRKAGNVWATDCGLLVDTHSVVEICMGLAPKVVWPKDVLDDINPMSIAWSKDDEKSLQMELK